MLNRIIKFSLNNRLLILIVAVLLMIGGIYTTRNMELDVFPDLNAPTVVVMTEAKDMAPEEVEKLVTFPIETAVNGATDVRRVRSTSTTGLSTVWIEFDWGTDIYLARQIVSEKLAIVKEQLPSNVENPTMGPQSSILGELMFVTLSSDSVSMQDLRTIADWTIRPRILATGGVAQVSVIGGEIKEYQILLSPEKMNYYGVALNEVLESVKDLNRNANGGVLYEYGNEYIIRGLLSTNNITDISQAIVKNNNNIPVMLGNIAEIKVGNSSPKMGVASLCTKPAVIMTITKQPNTNTLELTEKIDAVLSDLQKDLPKDVLMNTDVYRQERFINSSIDNVKKSLYEGTIFVVIVLFVFLMNIKTTTISLITIPLSLLASILTLKFMGLTINTMSLGGLAIAIGSLVDDAIVDVENVYKNLRENKTKIPEERKSVINVVFEASKEVRMPILNSTLIIIVSFVPLLFLSGMEGKMLIPLGIAFIVALCASTIVALTITPILCSYLLSDTQKEGVSIEKEPFVSRHLKSIYRKMLSWALLNKYKVLSFTAVLLLSAIVVFCNLGSSFLPAFNEGSFTINMSTMPGISLEESDKIATMVETQLLSIPEIEIVGRKTGRAELDEHALGVNVSEFEVPFVLTNRSKDEMLAELRTKMKRIPGINFEVGSPISHRIDAMLSGTRAGIAIKLFGTDLNKMYALGNEIKESIEDIDGVVDLNVEQQVERPQLKIVPKREMLAKYGISLPEFSNMVSVLLAGETVSQVYEGNKSFDLRLKVNDDNRDTMDKIKNMMVDAGNTKIPFGSIAEVSSSTGPNSINRENVSRKIVISANVSGRDLLGVVADIKKVVDDKIKLPEDFHIEYGGQFESQQKASRTLMITSVFSVLIIFLLLFNQFRNVKTSIMILVNLPLALIGGVFAISVTSGVVSIPAIIGFISLFGIATRNGMLLMSRYNDLHNEDLSDVECVIKGSIDRLNPILMTALTTGLALIPLAFAGAAPGNEIQSPMAQVILGGLLTSTLLNGFIVPIMYLMNSKNKSKDLENQLKIEEVEQ